MEINTYIRIILRYWWLVLLVTVAAASAAYGLDKVRKPTYSVQSRVVVRPSAVMTDTRAIVDLLGQMGGRYLTGTFAQSFTSANVKKAARQAVGLTDEQAANYPLEANVLPDSSVIAVNGTGPDASKLTDYVNATVTAAIADTRNLFQVLDMQPLEEARLPLAPSAPQPSRDVPFGALLGLALGLLLAFAIDYFRGERAEEEDEEPTVLQSVTYQNNKPGGPPVPLRAAAPDRE
ncbi:MAG: hypothetical protein M3014_10455 [Chloroflexota bacterium]|nr:hypothetical protein [Chloroflexota bacterium]